MLSFTHTLWLSWNEQIWNICHQQEMTSMQAAIHSQFRQGITDLLPTDYFYVTLGQPGFTLCQVLELPLDDPQLWLHAMQNAQTCSQGLTYKKEGRKETHTKV